MLHLALIVVAQLVEAQTVQRRVDERRQLRLENGIKLLDQWQLKKQQAKQKKQEEAR